MTDIIIISVVVLASITNMIADVFLASGKNHKVKKQSRIDIIKNTPDRHLFLSAYIGSVSISLWLIVLYYLVRIPDGKANIVIWTFSIYIAFVMTFHVVCSFIFYIVKYDESKFQTFKKVLAFFMVMCTVFSLAYTMSMLYLAQQGTIQMSILQILTLPFFSMIIIQFGLGNLLSKIPHFSSIAGTLGMLVALVSTISIFI